MSVQHFVGRVERTEVGQSTVVTPQGGTITLPVEYPLGEEVSIHLDRTSHTNIVSSEDPAKNLLNALIRGR